MENDFQLLIDDRVVWDCEKFVSIIKQPNSTIINGMKMMLQALENNYVYFNGWRFNTHSTIYPSANATEIVEGQKLLDNHAPSLFNRLHEIFFLQSVSEFRKFRPSNSIHKFCEIEPEMLDLLRLCYWYYKCHQIPQSNFLQFKSPEVRHKLAKGLLSNIEGYAMKIMNDFSGGTSEEFLIWLQGSLGKARLPKPPDKNLGRYVKKLSEDIRSIISELMFAALSNYNGYITAFDASPEPSHDYDFLINNLPVQVKTFNSSEDSQESIQKIEEIERKGSIDSNTLVKEIVDFLLSLTALNEMERAINQGAFIIFSDMSHIRTGHIIRKYLSEKNLIISLEDAITASVNIVTKDNKTTLPLIVCVSGTHYKYQIYALNFQIPVIKENNKFKLDRGRIQGFLV
jgi:hypothetical protein